LKEEYNVFEMKYKSLKARRWKFKCTYRVIHDIRAELQEVIS
jgi:hypothetical protein